MMGVELSRKVAVDRIPAEGQEEVVEAAPEECVALAKRMGVQALNRLRCRFVLTPVGAGVVRAEGWLEAVTLRECVVSLEMFESPTVEHFCVLFVPAGTESEDEDPDSEDEIGYSAGRIDLGEAAAEQLGLALDPWPHKPGAILPEAGDGVEMEPFATLVRPKAPH